MAKYEITTRANVRVGYFVNAPLSPPAGGDLSPALRRFGAVNWRGVWTLYLKEVRRFLKVFSQTIAAPVVTAFLFYIVFAVAFGGSARVIDGVPFVVFIAPGLVMMAIAQNAFANSSSSLIISKLQGNIVDVLSAPLSAIELTFGYAAGGVTRGLVVGLATALVIAVFVPVGIHSVAFIAYHAVAAALMLALLGIIGGIWATKFEHNAAVTNFVIMPLSFLSGTFYSIEALPALWRGVAQANPFFYMIDGFRYGFIGRHDAPLLTGVLVMAAINAGLLLVSYRMFATGYRLKA